MKNVKISSKKGGNTMQLPEEVDKILALREKGWGTKRIAKELGISRNTVKRYVRQKTWAPYNKPKRLKRLEGLEDWLEQTFRKHQGNSVVVHQELAKQHKIHLSKSTVRRAVQPLRKSLEMEAIATVRFETPPGKQMQIDFGSITVRINGEKTKVHFFAAILGFSRRQYVKVFLNERQTSWFSGIEGAFEHFGGIPAEILLDNAKALVKKHNPVSREVVFNDRFHTFANYWGFTPKACAPYRARTKGKDENTVKYIKKNAIAGHDFKSMEDLEGHLCWWMREVSDVRVHGTTHERPIDRFNEKEQNVLKPLNGKPPFHQVRELHRVVQTDACIELDTNFYSVPWHLIKHLVTVQLVDNDVRIFYEHKEVARHPVKTGRRERSIQEKHLKGVITPLQVAKEKKPADLLRPLSEYESIVGGAW